MLKCNLSVLLAERNLKITKVSKDTGISRTTLTSLANNYSQGIQLETLDTLCSYLKIKPSDFFCYVPFKIDIEVTHYKNEYFKANFNFINTTIKNYNQSISLNVLTFLYKDDPSNRKVSIILEPPLNDEYFLLLNRYMRDLPIIFKKDVRQKLCEEIYNYYFDDGYEESACEFGYGDDIADFFI